MATINNNYDKFKELSPGLQEALQNWLTWDKNETTLAEIQRLKPDELEGRLLSRLTFGTAGIRGAMGAGFSMMNDLVVIQTSQGLAAYAAECFNSSDKSVVIGYDGRYNSRRFAELAALAMLSKGFRVYLYGNLCPTPFVSYGVSYLGCSVGIMITASHNPKEDNGYKVYWANSAQIIAPHDKKIQASILLNLQPWQNAWATEELKANEKVSDPLMRVWDAYNSRLIENAYKPGLTKSSHVKITFTPMHGVGQAYMVKAFEVAGLEPFVSVNEQKLPDPEFSTVKFPNPEEGKSALNLAIKAAEHEKSTVILANDPDSDRLAVAEKNRNGSWTVFNGNEIGSLLAWWMMMRRNGSHSDNCFMISSTVSSKFIKSLAHKEGIFYTETLTGFKWMGNLAHDLILNGKQVLFAYEEAIGFMCGDVVLDKDGISAGVRMAELIHYLANQGLTLQDQLTELYKKYGYHISYTSYYICRDPEITKALFDGIRSKCSKEDIVFTATFDGVDVSCIPGMSTGSPTVRAVAYRDLTVGYDSEQHDKVPILPVSSSSQMITFKFDNGLILTIRGSGTEPKIKYYADFRVESTDDKQWPAIKRDLEKLVACIVEYLIGNYVSKLTPQSALSEEN